MEKRIYISATAHLDTTWLWTLRNTIERYLPETFERNFSLFEKYPDYRFSFEGSYRYELIEEYYPEAFEKLKKYVDEGRWCPAGSCYENGDVNVPSPEALIRNILYGTLYFKDKFGKTSNDIYLPDCFGFGAALPSVAAHCGLKGFVTGKLTWGSANGVPFDLGKWYGNDGSFVFAALKPGDYVRSFPSIRDNKECTDKLEDNIKKYDLPWTYLYHGAGDRGGAPSEYSVKNVSDEIKKNDVSDIKVLPVSSSRIFDDLSALPKENIEKLPEWRGELLMTEHGTGSYTSRAIGKRWNRRNEQLADAAEKAAVCAHYLRGYPYPRKAFEQAWKRVIAHQFHDDITGTSIMECYKKNWNDYAASMNMFAGEYTAALSAVCGDIDTSFCEGVPVAVNNPLQWRRNESVRVTLNWKSEKENARVFDRKGNEVYSQVVKCEDGRIELVFSADVPSGGVAVYDVRPSDDPCSLKSTLTVKDNVIENEFIKVTINKNGDISHIVDKKTGVDALASPVRLALIDNTEYTYWPAWEIKYKDIIKPVSGNPKLTGMKLIENGPSRIAFEITKQSGESVFRQIVSLDDKAKYVSVFNEIDWRSPATLLKAIFNSNAKNPEATYDIGLGSLKRPNNSEKLYEVPAQNFADITDESGKFGLSVFSDSRQGWDKPADNLLRLTCINTPKGSFRWECSQHLMEFGLNRFSFGIYPHAGGSENGSVQYACEFNQPLAAFETDNHPGSVKEDFSFFSVSDDSVCVRALKLSEKSDSIIVRFNETEGKAKTGVRFKIGEGIESAAEVNGIEEKTGDAVIQNGELVFDIGANCLKSFALTLKPKENKNEYVCTPVELPYNAKVMTENGRGSEATTSDGVSLPLEMMPDEILSGGALFRLRKGEKDAVFCENRAKVLPDGSKKLHLLVLSTQKTKLKVVFDGVYAEKSIGKSADKIGAWDLYALGETGFLSREPVAFEATHTHDENGDRVCEGLYLFNYTFDIPSHAVSFILLQSPDVYVLAASTDCDGHKFVSATELYDTLEKRDCTFNLSGSLKRAASPLAVEKLVYKKIPPETSWYKYGEKEARGRQITDIFGDKRAQIISKLLKK